jgi:membrane protein implicated in regulation of membrane protease activity
MLPDLTQYLWIAWIVLAVVFVIIELLTLEFTFLMLAAGAVIGGLGTNLLGGPWWLQVLLAAAVSALLLFTIRPLLLTALHRSSQPHPTNVDALYGMAARVTAPFVDGRGFVRLDNGEHGRQSRPGGARVLCRRPGGGHCGAWRHGRGRACLLPAAAPRRHPTLPKGVPTDGRRRSVRGQIFVIVLLVVIAIFVIVVLFRSIRIIPQAYTGVVERLGRYQRTLSPG